MARFCSKMNIARSSGFKVTRHDPHFNTVQ
jgi:hypothetical protein